MVQKDKIWCKKLTKEIGVKSRVTRETLHVITLKSDLQNLTFKIRLARLDPQNYISKIRHLKLNL